MSNNEYFDEFDDDEEEIYLEYFYDDEDNFREELEDSLIDINDIDFVNSGQNMALPVKPNSYNNLNIKHHYKKILDLAKNSDYKIAVKFYYQEWNFYGFILDYNEDNNTITTLDFTANTKSDDNREKIIGYTIGIHDVNNAVLLEITTSYPNFFGTYINILKQDKDSILYKYNL